MIGTKFGRLVVTEQTNQQAIGGWFWKCACECGSEVVVGEERLRKGRKKSCGECLDQKGVARTHGGSETREYNIWGHMIQRCHNPKRDAYYRYGARGITVCDRWRESYAAFLEDMGNAPFKDAQLDRIDNDGNYEPGNCRWVSQAENKRNKANARYIEHDGRRMCMSDWARELGVPPRLLSVRIGRGWTDTEVITGVRTTELPPPKNTRWITHDGKTLPLPEWARILGVARSKLNNRYERGWSGSEIIMGVRQKGEHQ